MKNYQIRLQILQIEEKERRLRKQREFLQSLVEGDEQDGPKIRHDS